MILKFKKNPETCIEMAALIGYPVNSMTRLSDGSVVEIDIGVPSLNPAQRKELREKLELSQIHLAEVESN